MKKIITVFTLILFISCNKETPRFVTFSGKISNINTADSILVLKSKNTSKNFKISKDGSFKDTLNVSSAGYYTMSINGRNVGYTFLRNGFDLNLTADNNNFFESTNYKGNGANSINYLLAQNKLGRSFGDPRLLFSLEKDAFNKKVNVMKNSFDSLKKLYKDIDTTLLKRNDKQNDQFFSMLTKNYDRQHAIAKQQALTREKLAKGKKSPKFNGYLNFKGGKNSLDSFKGKYVYIDVWATWCNPCIAEIPSLKRLEKKYHNKNINFVSISIDDKRTAGSWDNALSKWKAMVKDKNLTGTQLYAGQDIEFMKEYMVTGIPRFILIDPKGNIVDANAPRPSNPALEKLFNELGI